LIPSGGQTATTLAITAITITAPAGSPVLVNAVVTNTSDKDISMWASKTEVPAAGRFKADVVDDEGRPAVETRLGAYHDGHLDLRKLDPRDMDGSVLTVSGFCFTLRAGGSSKGVVDLSTLYSLDDPGRYTVVLTMVDPVSGATVKSNPVTVTVGPALKSRTPQAAEQPTGIHPFALDLSADETTVKKTVPVDVLVVTKDVSAHKITIRRQALSHDSAMLGSSFRVDVQDVEGNTPLDAALGQSTNHLGEAPPEAASMAAARAAGTLVSLKPGQDWRNTIRVSDLYDLSKPGQYTIQVRRWDDETKTWVKSNKITVTVTP